MAGHAQLKIVMTECSKTQIRLTRLKLSEIFWQFSDTIIFMILYRLDTGSLTPSEVQVDLLSNHSINSPVDNDTARSKDSDTLSVSHEDKKRTISCPGSPISGCGSICGVEDGKPLNIRCKRCRRLARQMAVTEHMNVHFSDQVSLQSFQAEDLVLDLPMGKQGTDSLSQKCSEALELTEVETDIDNLNAGLTSVGKGRQCEEPVILLTEVENDRPTFIFYKEGKHDGAEHRNGAEDGASEKIKEKKKLCLDIGDNTSESTSVMDGYVIDSSPIITCPEEESYRLATREVKRQRHMSCELAGETGRISPSPDRKHSTSS